jgi:hypothetical protein
MRRETPAMCRTGKALRVSGTPWGEYGKRMHKCGKGGLGGGWRMAGGGAVPCCAVLC